MTLVVRAQSLAAGMSHYLAREVQATPNVDLRLATEVIGGGGDDGWLDHLVLRDMATGQEETVSAVGLFLMIGAHPHTDWLPAEVSRDPRGFILTGGELPPSAWSLERIPFGLETSMHGVLAAGDVRHGSVKRVASAVGEGSMAIQSLHGLFEADGLERTGPRPQVVS